MAFSASEMERMKPNNTSDMGMRDDDSGMRLFRGMMSPWDQIKSFKETYNFLVRHAALFGVGYVNALKLVEPDYEKRTTLMSSIWGQSNQYLWSQDFMHQGFQQDFDVPPFFGDSLYKAATYADKGDEQSLMAGHIWYAQNDRWEKEIHQCQFDIVGPEACDVSQGGGRYFCVGLAGVPLNTYNSERMGCGDPYCHVVQERACKHGEHPNKEGFDWENWGPPNSGMRQEGMERKKECEFLTSGVFTAATGATFTAGQLYKDNAGGLPMFMSFQAIDAMRAMLKEKPELQTMIDHVIDTLFDTIGKVQFGEWNTRKAAREWMGTPADVEDGRTLGGYISMVFQARNMNWSFTEFSPERAVVECDKAQLEMMGMYPEITKAYVSFFNGAAKTLVNTQWVVKLGEDAPEGKLRFAVEKGLYGYRRQKPGKDFE